MLQVLDHEPHSWFLLRDGDRLYLDVACEASFVGYTVLIELDDRERDTVAERGRGYLHDLAAEINDGAPVMRESRSPYKGRDLSRTLGGAVTDAVRRWRAGDAPEATG